jgi:iron complex transport system ATP-binding protein
MVMIHMTKEILSLHQVSAGYDDRTVIHDISFSIQPGQVVSILGPNGVGKTTLFLTILGLIQPFSGEIELDGHRSASLSPRERAKWIAYVPQVHKPTFSYTVAEIIRMGRTPHLQFLGQPSAADHAIIREVMKTMGIYHLRDRVYTQLSGGERQLVLIARAIAQQPGILMMDEPTSNLDFGNQTLVLHLIREFSRQGIAVIMTTHSPNQALLCASQVILFKPDATYLVGSSEEVITENNLFAAYGVPVKLLDYQIKPDRVLQTCIPILE